MSAYHGVGAGPGWLITVAKRGATVYMIPKMLPSVEYRIQVEELCSCSGRGVFESRQAISALFDLQTQPLLHTLYSSTPILADQILPPSPAKIMPFPQVLS
jgi:hypothetical protein